MSGSIKGRTGSISVFFPSGFMPVNLQEVPIYFNWTHFL